MTESQQPQRGRFSTWREQRRLQRQLAIESQLFTPEQAGEFGGRYGSSSPYGQTGPITYGAGGGWDGGGGCGDGGGC